MELANRLIEEKGDRFHGGLYHKTQVNLAYNSNRIEGSRLSEEQTRYIFEIRTIGFKEEEAVPVDDIIETCNHFVVFDYMLDTLKQPLSTEIITEFHKMMKFGTADSLKSRFSNGNWKKMPIEFRCANTSDFEYLNTDIEQLHEWYFKEEVISLETIVEYHYRFMKIHPFRNDNGRVGRLIMFRECLKNHIVPFIIEDSHKEIYYQGLNAFEEEHDNLIDTCRLAHDTYNHWIFYFYPDHFIKSSYLNIKHNTIEKQNE